MTTKITIIPAREAKNRFGELLHVAQHTPVIITRKGRPVAKVIAFVDKARFEEVEDQIWGERANRAAKEGYFGPKRSKDFMSSLRKRYALPRSRQ